MEKRDKRKIYVMLLLGLFMISILATHVIAQTEVKGGEVFLEKFQEILNNIFSGNTKAAYYVTNVLSPQILFGILVFLVIFAVISRMSIFDKIRIPLSIVVAILAAGFINIEWIKPLLNQYTAIGVTITLLLPFVLIFYFLKEVAPYNQLIQKIVWVVFLVVVIINALMNWNNPTSTNITRWIYGIIIGGSSIMLLFGRNIFKMIWKEELHEAIDKYHDITELISAGKKADAQSALNSIGSQLSESQKNRLQQYIDRLG